MCKKYDKYYLSFSFALLLYLIFRYNHLGSQYSICDILMLYVLALMIWFMKMNYRHFVMSISRLHKFGGREKLEYCLYSNKKHEVKNIYVRACKENDYDTITDDSWYELDYILTLSTKLSVDEYKKFFSRNNTVSKLLDTMNCNYDISHLAYKRMKSDYNCFRYLALSFILVAICFNLLVFYNM